VLVPVSGSWQLSVGSSQQEGAECRQSPILRVLRVLRARLSTVNRATLPNSVICEICGLFPPASDLGLDAASPYQRMVNFCRVTKEVIGFYGLLMHPLFGGDILRRFLQRVSLAKPTSAPLRF
jgi:hypothetical protein